MGKRYVPRHAAPGRHQAPRKVSPTTEQEHAPAAKRSVQQPTRSRRKPHKVGRIIVCIELAAIVVLGALLATFLLRRDELKGTWALDETTVYEFDGRGNGILLLPLGSYEFSYSIEDNVLSIDFADSAVADAAYSYSVESSALTLDTNTGNVYRLVKQE